MKTTTLLLFVCVLTAVADGTTYEFVNSTDATPGFHTAANWKGGAEPGYLAGNSTMVGNVFLFDTTATMMQTLSMADGSTKDGGWNTPGYWGIVTGKAAQVRLNILPDLGSRYIVVPDASGFAGLIGTTGGGHLILAPSAEREAHVNNLLTFNSPSVLMKEADTRGYLDHVWGVGQWLVNFSGSGAGNKTATVEVRDEQSRGMANVSVYGGTFAVNPPAAAAPAIVGTPWLHLDASVPSTLTTETVGDSMLVTRWTDVRGDGPALVQDGAKQRPSVVTDPGTGKHVVDFGVFSARASRLAGLGGPAATLVFEDGAKGGIRDVFVVFRDAPVGNTSDSTSKPIVQNFLGNAKGAAQYFPRATKKRTSATWYLNYLIDTGADTSSVYSDDGAQKFNAALSDIRLDGARVSGKEGDDLSRHLHVFSMGSAGDATADRLASNGRGDYGGIVIAEVLVYTNALTSSERRQVNAALCAKWKANGGCAPSDRDFGFVQMSGAENLEVGANGASFGQLRLFGSRTLNKLGSGKLTVGAITGREDANVTVMGGAIAFDEDDSLADFIAPDSPPVAPEWWFDADVGVQTFVTNCFGETVEYVERWDERRDGTNLWGAVCNMRRYNKTHNLYKVGDACYPAMESNAVEVAGVKHNLIDCGDTFRNNLYSSATKTTTYIWDHAHDGAGLVLSDSRNATWNSHYTQFAVVRPKTHAFVTGAEIAQQAVGSAPIGIGSTAGFGLGMDYRINGERVDHLTTAVTLEAGKLYVISLQLPALSGLGAQFDLGVSAIGSYGIGGCAFGESLAYPHALTERERIATEAYLMKKWLGREHPAVLRAKNGVKLASLTFAEGVDNTVETAQDLSVGVLTVTSDTLVKKGAGVLKASATKGVVKAIEVGGGSVETALDAIDLSDAMLHLDASVKSSFTFRAEPGLESSIVKWSDASGRDVVASSVVSPIEGPEGKSSGYRGHDCGLTNAQYCVSDGTDGLVAGVPYVDFLKKKNKATYPNNIQILAASNDCAMMTFPRVKNLREMHVVFASADGEIVSSEEYARESGYVHWMSSASREIFNSSGGKIPGLSPLYWDGNGDCYTNVVKTAMGAGFHVASVQLVDNCDVSRLAGDRVNCGRGGAKICEVIFFDKTNTVERAKAINCYLAAKWRGIAAEKACAMLDDVRLAESSTLKINGDLKFGEGLNLTSVSGMTVTGTVYLPESGTIRFAPTAKLAKGFYPILSAGAFSGDWNNLTLDTTGANPNRTYKMVQRDDSIGIEVGCFGLCIMVR